MVAHENLEETSYHGATDSTGHAKDKFDHINSLIQFPDKIFRHVLLVLSLKNNRTILILLIGALL